MFRFLLRTFIKNCDDVRDPHVRELYGVLAGGAGILLNLLLSLGKLSAGLLTGAVSVTADAFNNLSDAASSLATLVGFRMAARKPDALHPFGHGRIEYLVGLGVSVAILVVGLELGESALKQILHPEPVVFSWLSVGVLSASICVKLWMFGFNRYLGRRIDSAAILAASADALSDCIATGAVLLGLLVYRATSLPVDGWAGLLVSIFVLKAGWDSAKDTISPLLGQAPDLDMIHELRAVVLEHPEIAGIHDLVLHDYGPGNTMATFHAEVAEDANIRAIHNVIEQVERELWDRFHIEATIHVDPMVTSDPWIISLSEKTLHLARRLDPGITLHDFHVNRSEEKLEVAFGLMVPRSCTFTDYQIRRELGRWLTELEPDCMAVIHVDHPYYSE